MQAKTAAAGQANLHVHKLEGSNWHHLVEITFKAFAKALNGAFTPNAALKRAMRAARKARRA